MKLIEYRKIARAVEADVKAALAKHGLDVKPFGARIDERLGIVRMTLECVDVNHKAPDGTATTPEREVYKQLCRLYDLKPEWLDATLSLGGKQYRVVGLKRRGTKIVLVERIGDGARLVATPEQIASAFALAAVRKGSAAA